MAVDDVGRYWGVTGAHGTQHVTNCQQTTWRQAASAPTNALVPPSSATTASVSLWQPCPHHGNHARTTVALQGGIGLPLACVYPAADEVQQRCGAFVGRVRQHQLRQYNTCVAVAAAVQVPYRGVKGAFTRTDAFVVQQACDGCRASPRHVSIGLADRNAHPATTTQRRGVAWRGVARASHLAIN